MISAPATHIWSDPFKLCLPGQLRAEAGPHQLVGRVAQRCRQPGGRAEPRQDLHEQQTGGMRLSHQTKSRTPVLVVEPSSYDLTCY